MKAADERGGTNEHEHRRASAQEARMSSGASAGGTRGADARMRGANELMSIGGRAVPGPGGRMSAADHQPDSG